MLGSVCVGSGRRFRSRGRLSVLVIDARTGDVLYEKNADQQRAAASTQKLLTSLIVAERGFLDRPVGRARPTPTRSR